MISLKYHVDYLINIKPVFKEIEGELLDKTMQPFLW